MIVNRRQFLQQAGALTLAFTGLRQFTSLASAEDAAAAASAGTAKGVGYGALVPDPKGMFDLPKGFSYRVIARTGDKMNDGFLVPGMPDGMAAFAGSNGNTIVVCNHELNPDASNGPFGKDNELLSKLQPELIYDRGSGKPLPGGTTTFVYDGKTRKIVDHRLSLVGTSRNCAGGPTPWNSWITCEESVIPKGVNVKQSGQITEQNHGYAFEVPAWTGGKPVKPEPIRAMGRFYREAVAVDPRSGIVFQTEDLGDGLIYRYIPNTPGKLMEGGKLQALKVKDRPSLKTQNWEEETVAQGVSLAVEWIDLDDVESPADDLRKRGFAAGATQFARGEGMWYGGGSVFFCCTNGGKAKKGQVWKYTPSPNEGTAAEKDNPGRLELFVEPNDKNVLENCDNITYSPWGDLVLCEDGNPDQFLVGVTPWGELYQLGRNAGSKSELAGACFSPDGKTLFVNIQGDGITLAITGPWKTA